MFYAQQVFVIQTIFIFTVGVSGVLSEQPIFKCCEHNKQVNPLASVLSEELVIHNENKDLLPSNTTKNDLKLQLGDKVGILEVKQCHPDEGRLTITFSLSPEDLIQLLDPSGYFRSNDTLYSPSQYCIKTIDNGYEVKAQPLEYCDGQNCIRKCCGTQEVYDLSTYGISKLQCVSSANNPWRPHFYSTKEGFPTVGFKPEPPRSWCKNANAVLWSLKNIRNDRRSLFHVMRNGSVMMKDRTTWRALNTSSICIDGAINFPGHFDENAKQETYSGNELDTIIIECGPELAEKSDSPLVLYGVALAVATVFQFSTLLVNGLLWEKQNIHGWTLLGYVATMFLFYISMLATFFYLYNNPDPDFITESEIFGSFCGIIAVVNHFLYICTICWLTVISTDIFLTFRILKLTRTRSKHKMKFLIYLIFTLFVPSVIVLVGVLLDISYGDNIQTDIILPRYGWNKCFLDLKNAAWPYLFGPIGVLLVLNCVMYFATIFHMYQIQESTKFANTNNSQVQKQRTKSRLFSKLFLLMGVSWIWEVISFAAFGAETNAIVIIGDMFNILKPIVIFIIFVCKRDILKSLGEKYSFVTKVFSSVEPDEFTSSSSSATRPPKLTKLWNPVHTPKWFRSRINSTMTETSNLSNQSIKSLSSINVMTESPIEESPVPITSSSPLNMELQVAPQ